MSSKLVVAHFCVYDLSVEEQAQGKHVAEVQVTHMKAEITGRPHGINLVMSLQHLVLTMSCWKLLTSMSVWKVCLGHRDGLTLHHQHLLVLWRRHLFLPHHILIF